MFEKMKISFLLAEIPSRKFMFFYALRNELLRLGNEFHRFLFSQELNFTVFWKFNLFHLWDLWRPLKAFLSMKHSLAVGIPAKMKESTILDRKWI